MFEGVFYVMLAPLKLRKDKMYINIIIIIINIMFEKMSQKVLLPRTMNSKQSVVEPRTCMDSGYRW